MDVVLDTNIYQSYFSMETNQMASLAAYLKKTDDQLFIPFIIAQELNRNYNSALEKSFGELEKAARSFDKLLVSYELDSLSKTLNSFKDYQTKIATVNYIEYIRGFMPNVLIQDSLPAIDFSSVVKKGLDKVKPFKISGEGMKNAILWESILEYCKTKGISRIIFISNNSSDFGKETLEPNLFEQSKEIGVNIVYYNGLARFIENEFTTVDGVNLQISDIDYESLKNQMDFIFSKKGELDTFYKKRSTQNDTFFDYYGINLFDILHIERFIVKDIDTEFKYVHAKVICKISIILMHESYRTYAGGDGAMDYNHSFEVDELPATIWGDITLKLTDKGFSDLQLNATGFAD